ncbi:hypothetical protein ACHHYP_04930 [Achlya hypogyna]|uniref:USP8 dimerisation domain-containing protein n=1 Tax=Achlya hypogyna TaxID=1202772 RepID=A0A1V9YZK2_ACHHY|nr:hypothetical protein ACHHYP_04930 [Achlya hypogyna]
MDPVSDLARKVADARELCLAGDYTVGSALLRECVRSSIYLRRTLRNSPDLAPMLETFVDCTKREHAAVHRYVTALALLQQAKTSEVGPKKALERIAHTYSSPPQSPATASRKRRASILDTAAAAKPSLML